jgi:dienelactone hydrolase
VGATSGVTARAVRRIAIDDSGIVGVVFEPAEQSEGFVVMLGGSFGGVPEAPARRLAEHGLTAFALGYFGAPGLPPALVEVPTESVQHGIEWFRETYAANHAVGVLGFSKGAELALVIAAQLGETVGAVVAVAPSHVVWFGLKPPGADGDPRSECSSWSRGRVGLPFLPRSPELKPVFTEKGLRTDVFFDPTAYEPEAVEAARIPVERIAGPLLLLAGDDDHQWPALPMMDEVVRHMGKRGRAAEVTRVVYPGAGHAFLVQDFLPPPGVGPAFDYGGTIEADRLAGEDSWRRIAGFLRGPTG